jgi:hypothetical protein
MLPNLQDGDDTKAGDTSGASTSASGPHLSADGTDVGQSAAHASLEHLIPRVAKAISTTGAAEHHAVMWHQARPAFGSCLWATCVQACVADWAVCAWGVC